jgi:hypothetical protein
MNGSFPQASTICPRIYFGNLDGDHPADFRRFVPTMQEEHTSTDGMGAFAPPALTGRPTEISFDYGEGRVDRCEVLGT